MPRNVDIDVSNITKHLSNEISRLTLDTAMQTARANKLDDMLSDLEMQHSSVNEELKKVQTENASLTQQLGQLKREHDELKLQHKLVSKEVVDEQ